MHKNFVRNYFAWTIATSLTFNSNYEAAAADSYI